MAIFVAYPRLIAADKAHPFARELARALDATVITPLVYSRLVQGESGWDAAAVNPQSGASGLQQWMPDTAKGLGSSVEEIRKQDAAGQLPLMLKTIGVMDKLLRARMAPSSGAGGAGAGGAGAEGSGGGTAADDTTAGKASLRDVVLCNMFPSAVGASDSTVLARAGEPAFNQNAAAAPGKPGIPTATQGVLTVGDIGAWASSRLAADLFRFGLWESETGRMFGGVGGASGGSTSGGSTSGGSTSGGSTSGGSMSGGSTSGKLGAGIILAGGLGLALLWGARR